MITLYVNKLDAGATRDLRVQWALEELGLPYRVHGLDHATKAFREKNVFGQLPVIDDDGFVLQESAAILLYLAEKAGATPPDRKHYAALLRWCFAAVNTVEPALQTDEPQRVLRPLDVHLAANAFLLGADFSVADILMTTTLRLARDAEQLRPFERVEAYRQRCEARPAFTRSAADHL